ncbi:MAG: RluA family pseudouridine synthase [Clostridiales Family XIII bacterium]|nr:RluA family pseudouridine synthase [Clostridiales Family XIII bacterium]
MNELQSEITIKAEAADDGLTVRTLLRHAGVSARLMTKIRHGGGQEAGGGAVTLRGEPARSRDIVRAGDEVRVVFPEEKTWFEPEDIPVSVIFEDDDLLVVDKQPGLVVHPTKGHHGGTLANGIAAHMLARGEQYQPRFASRLDMNTSGVLTVCKNGHAQWSLAQQQEAGTITKIYLALAEGEFAEPRGLIDLPIAPPVDGTPQRLVRQADEGGRLAQTEYEALGFFAYGEDRFSLVRLRLLTGRTHQIRVHLAAIGHPVLGDTLYGAASSLIGRQALHASEISFAHPKDGRPLNFSSPLPEDMALLLPCHGS